MKKLPILIRFVGFLLAFIYGQTSFAAHIRDTTTFSAIHVQGSIHANSNGFALVPTFSLGKPALQAGFSLRGKGRLSFLPQIWYSMFDYKPWSFIFIWRYDVVRKEKFKWVIGTHAPALNFKSRTILENGIPEEIIWVRRFYPALEIMPVYSVNNKLNLSMYVLLGTGIEKEVSSKNTFISLRTDFNDIPVSGKFYLQLNPQIYYLRIDDTDGVYVAAQLTLAHRRWPLSFSSMFNQKIKSEVVSKSLEWNAGLVYTFAKSYSVRKT